MKINQEINEKLVKNYEKLTDNYDKILDLRESQINELKKAFNIIKEKIALVGSFTLKNIDKGMDLDDIKQMFKNDFADILKSMPYYTEFVVDNKSLNNIKEAMAVFGIEDFDNPITE